MDRTPLIAGNWKMHTTVEEARLLLRALVAAGLGRVPGVEVAVCPPFVSLVPAAEILAESGIALGAQNLYPEPKGAFTGEIAPTMLQGLCTYVIVGHSERRRYFGEDDAFVNRKVRAALDHGLRPIVCVGETLEEREAGRTLEVLARQVRGAFQGIAPDEALRCVVAYEPVWAIGTGVPATPQDANEGCGFVRRQLADLVGEEVAARIRIQYGGSVKPENAEVLLSQPEVDGALVGGASLKAEAFAAIVRTAARAKGSA